MQITNNTFLYKKFYISTLFVNFTGSKKKLEKISSWQKYTIT